MYETIARSVVPGDYGPLSDDDLTAVAAQTFALLNEEESLVPTRGEVWLVDLGIVQKARPALILNRGFKESEWRAGCVNSEPGGEVSQNSRSSQHAAARWVTPVWRGSFGIEQWQEAFLSPP